MDNMNVDHEYCKAREAHNSYRCSTCRDEERLGSCDLCHTKKAAITRFGWLGWVVGLVLFPDTLSASLRPSHVTVVLFAVVLADREVHRFEVCMYILSTVHLRVGVRRSET